MSLNAWLYFVSRVTVTSDGCWEWLGAKCPKGYGRLKIGGRKGRVTTAHRYAWLLTYGDPGELCVLHDCDNSSCCNPDHLHLGTIRDNNIEMRERGRQYQLVPPSLYPNIVDRYQSGETQTSIATEFGVDRTTIGLILRKLGVPEYRKAFLHDKNGYSRGCRCAVCTEAWRLYTHEYRRQKRAREIAG